MATMLFVNRVKFATPTQGGGAMTIGAAAVGYQTPAASGIATGTTTGYAIEDGPNWEVGQGTYTAITSSFSRDSVESSSAGGAYIDLSGGATCFFTLTAGTMNALEAMAQASATLVAAVAALQAMQPTISLSLPTGTPAEGAQWIVVT